MLNIMQDVSARSPALAERGYQLLQRYSWSAPCIDSFVKARTLAADAVCASRPPTAVNPPRPVCVLLGYCRLSYSLALLVQLVLDVPVVCVDNQEPRIFAKLIMQGFVLRIAAFCVFMLNMKAAK